MLLEQTFTLTVQDNRKFRNVNIRAGELAAGESVDLTVMGTDDTTQMHYNLADLIIQEQAALTIGQDVRLTINENQKITVNGTLDVQNADSITATESRGGQTMGFSVNGQMTATGSG